MLSPGRLRHRVTIRRNTPKPTGKGGFEDAWSDVATVWAEVIGIAGREATIGQALQSISAYRVTIRFGADVTDVDQLRYGAIDINIRSVTDPDGMREQLLILGDTGSALSTGS